LRSETTIGKLRLGWHEYEGIPLKPTYHPAYLLRSPGEKRKTWEDVLEVLRVYRGGNPDDSTGA
jgi:DNA polymerase